MSGGSIAEFYHKMGHAFDEDLTRHYTKQIVDAVAYMHSNGIIHRVGCVLSQISGSNTPL